ncbi:Hsp20/alpha crystallin family protein [Cupriavidus pampae]|uniref:18 kDa heat shock protein n=1 Tax=Cupriavidus pampae TaxID=659251 RepID=A0ABM8WFW0_9BURK|nr:Hsp20/alpha crystallin family protein [Cupriavidus pampae]CAG9165995.1 18 kDa heat shock protein [Cupriavidus pampae]
MSNIRLYDPFSIEPIGDMLHGMMRAFGSSTDAGLAFKVDVTESDKDYTVVAEIPGAKKEDLHVSVERGTVLISAKVEKASEEKQGERVIRRERYSGTMQRAFTLATPIDEARVEAHYQDGVLRLSLPKSQATPQRRIEIH